MLFCFTTEKNTEIFKKNLASCRETVGENQVLELYISSYNQIDLSYKLPGGVYLFSDLERLSGLEMKLLKNLVGCLEAFPKDYLVINNPNRWLGRYELLKKLYEVGINDFNVYRLHEVKQGKKIQFPVFLRMDNDHSGSRSDLLYSFSELEQAIDRLPRFQRLIRHRIMVVEYCDTADKQGIFRKYSATNFNGHLMPRHILFSKKWMLKRIDLVDKSTVDEEQEFANNFPHQQLLREIFELGGVDYGRIDYSLKDGRIQVWEINTNPVIWKPESLVSPLRLPLHRQLASEGFENFQKISSLVPYNAGQSLFSPPQFLAWQGVQMLGKVYSRWRL